MPAETAEYLFDVTLIPSELRQSLPAGLSLRPLASSDYSRGHLDLLAHLTSSPDVGKQTWSTRFDEMRAVNAVQLTYLPVVIVEDGSDRLVGQATVVVERKFLRGAGLVGHVEDVVVDPKMQGKKLGLKLLEVVTALSERVGAYKVRTAFPQSFLDRVLTLAILQTILDCDPKNEGALGSNYAAEPSANLVRLLASAFYVKCGYVVSLFGLTVTC